MPSRPSRKPRSRKRRRQVYATRQELQALLDIIDRNTTRIERLEDVFALEAKERAEVKGELDAIKALLLRSR